MPNIPRRFFNRELSWLEFNSRVLEESMDETHPLLERAKFLAIFHTNLDEFFMIRVSGLQEQVESGLVEQSPDGLTPIEQLERIRARVAELTGTAAQHWEETLRPRLAASGVMVYDYGQLSKHQKAYAREYYETTVFPVLTPLAVDPAHPFPHISNLSLNLAVVIRDERRHFKFARVKIPQVLPRLVPVCSPTGKQKTGGGRRHHFVWLEQLVAAHLDTLFKGMRVVASYPFRVVRDADLEIREDEAGDLLQSIEESIARRRFGSVTCMQLGTGTPDNVRVLLQHNMEIEASEVYEAKGPLGLGDLMSLMALDLPRHKDPPFRPRVPAALSQSSDLFECIRRQDVVLHHPYDSFAPVVQFVQAAAADPNVLAIKQTIYRVGSRSPIVAALVEAGECGKQVSVVVELKARFDEENNIGWARALEKAGAHVVYSEVKLKTHCKALLVVRREDDGIRRYVHLGTGNYNAGTARIYTDLGLFTCDPDVADDVSALFNVLTGYAVNTGYKKLLVSPGGIRTGLTERIESEIEHAQAGRGGHIVCKMNSLTDYRSAEALYRAGQAGVKVDLIIRGSCCLVPGVPDLSPNIRVISIVGRFLEHHRIYYFRNGGQGNEEVWLGSADMMQRNLDRRVETLFPIEDAELRKAVLRDVLLPHLADTCKARQLQPDGSYARVQPGGSNLPFCVQEWFLEREADSAAPSSDRKIRVGD